MKRWTSWLLATVLTAFLLSCDGKTALDILAVPAEASILDLWKNKKTTELRTAEDLEKLRKNPEGRFELTQDITVNGSTFSPIEEFNGTLNGNGHWIFGLSPRGESNVVTGLFDSLGSKAVVHSLGVEVKVQMYDRLPAHISGMARSNQGTIECCYVLSTIQCSASGGAEEAMDLGVYAPVAQNNSGKINDCTLQTTGTGFGVVYGAVEENNGSITNCKVELNTDGCWNVSGIAARNWETVKDCTVSVNAKYVQNFYYVASQNYGTVQNSHFTAQLQAPVAAMPSWDASYPGISESFDSSNTVQVTNLPDGYSIGGCQGSGTQWDPYLLRTPEDLEQLRAMPNAWFRLEDDMDFRGRTFAPIKEFSGVLEGNNHAIYGLSYEFSPGESIQAAALIWNLTSEGRIENLSLSCSMDAGKLENADGAGLVLSNGGTIMGCAVTAYAVNCHAIGGITRNNASSGIIKDCSVYLNADRCGFVGGIAEYQTGTLLRCTAQLEVKAPTGMGGISYANGGTLQDCTAGGTVDTRNKNGILASLIGENLGNSYVSGSQGTVYNTATGNYLPSIGNS